MTKTWVLKQTHRKLNTTCMFVFCHQNAGQIKVTNTSLETVSKIRCLKPKLETEIPFYKKLSKDKLGETCCHSDRHLSPSRRCRQPKKENTVFGSETEGVTAS
jgi:hypothetical protein